MDRSLGGFAALTGRKEGQSQKGEKVGVHGDLRDRATLLA